jgi:hypothetical protein
LSRLDSIDGFRGHGREGNLFRRELVELDTGDLVWTYRLASAPPASTGRIASWRQRTHPAPSSPAELLAALAREVEARPDEPRSPGTGVAWWGGADLVVADGPWCAPARDPEAFPRWEEVVVTPHARSLAWLLARFCRDYQPHERENKYGFYRRVALAAAAEVGERSALLAAIRAAPPAAG